jgi:molybdenum cofactor biosynthesis protein B
MTDETHGPTHARHREHALAVGPIAVALITVSDTRTLETDTSGQFLVDALKREGHRLVERRIIQDDPAQVQRAVHELAAGEAQVILINGGTGISRRDTTFDAVSQLLQKELPGFGELFRMLSFREIGAAAMLSRAVAGVFNDTVIISTPGSTAAVRLAWDQLLKSEIAHLVWELRR